MRLRVEPVFKTFAAFLGGVALRKIAPLDMRLAVPDSVSTNVDVVFQTGENYELKLNLFTPKNSSKALPLVVMIHGGCWIDGGRVDYNFYGVKLAQLGYAAATVDYRVADQARYPAAVDDLRNAIQWLKDHAKTYNIDSDRFALLGGSAGGHLVELIGYAASAPTTQHPRGARTESEGHYRFLRLERFDRARLSGILTGMKLSSARSTQTPRSFTRKPRQ